MADRHGVIRASGFGFLSDFGFRISDLSTVNIEMHSDRFAWLLLHSGVNSAAFNMALDEALLEAMPHLGKPLLRFFAWAERAASFGYSQRYAEVEGATVLRPLILRPTGGGLVPHDADWTYSLVFPADAEWYSLPAVDSYRRAHDWLRAAFAKLNVVTELAPDCHRAGPGQCFVGHEQFDLLWRGKKIAGAAQRRTRNGLLIQGSVQPPAAIARADWERAMCDAAGTGVAWTEFALDAALRERAAALARQKYSQAGYNRKR